MGTAIGISVIVVAGLFAAGAAMSAFVDHINDAPARRLSGLFILGGAGLKIVGWTPALPGVAILHLSPLGLLAWTVLSPFVWPAVVVLGFFLLLAKE